MHVSTMRNSKKMVMRSKLLVAAVILGVLLLLNVEFGTRGNPAGAEDSNTEGIKHWEDSKSGICDRSRYPRQWELRSDQLTVLINGFSETRLPLLRNIVRSYSASPAVHSIFVLWGNRSTPSEVLEAQGFESMGAPIHVVRQPTESLNDRFLPRGSVATRSVLVCDDDVEIDGRSLGFALRAWEQGRGRRIVGFFARSHEFELGTKTWIYAVHPDRYSIVLTKLMVVATEFLYAYTCRIPPGVRDYVDRSRNCEDIAMNFLAADRTGVGPLLVEGTPRDWGDPRNSGGGRVVDAALSSREDHRKDRGACIAEFHRLWGRMPLRYSYGRISPTVGEQALCEKAGALLLCDREVADSTPGTP